MLGTVMGIGTQLSNEEFAKWITAADPDAILAGANAGAKYAVSSSGSPSRPWGIAAGAGLGLLSSYVESDEGHRIRETVDADLYEEYLDALEG